MKRTLVYIQYNYMHFFFWSACMGENIPSARMLFIIDPEGFYWILSFFKALLTHHEL